MFIFDHCDYSNKNIFNIFISKKQIIVSSETKAKAKAVTQQVS